MEIKHTVEILTKDIQEIEKLVRNLSNFQSPPQIELDLAMSKLRNVYDLLYTISSDLKKDALKEQSDAGKEPHVQVLEVIKPGIPEEQESRNISEQQHHTQATIEKKPEPEPAPQAETEEAPVHVTQEPEPVQEEAQPEPEPESVQEETPAQESKSDSTQTEQSVKKETREKKEAEILAEKFETDKSLNERIARKGNNDLSSKLSSEPIDSIKRNIGINDRFLIIRELMNGDNEAYNELVQKLDACQNFNEAFSILENKFDDLEHEGSRLLVNLARRKYIGKENV